MSIGIAYNPCKNCKEMDKCSICELTYYRKGYIKSPSADVAEVRHGYWDKRYSKNIDHLGEFLKFDGYFCSICGAMGYGKYCSECGAKMDGERSEDGKS